MPNGPKKRPRDPNALAHQVFLESIGEAPKYEPTAKNAKAISRGALGGTARAARLAPKKRSAIAVKAAKARWKKPDR